jgi:NADH-quinone oxidoreductase subunit G
LAPEPYLAFNPDDALSLGLSIGSPVIVSTGGVEVRLPVQIDSSLARGLAGLPAGLPGVPWLDLPHRGSTITLAEQEG